MELLRMRSPVLGSKRLEISPSANTYRSSFLQGSESTMQNGVDSPDRMDISDSSITSPDFSKTFKGQLTYNRNGDLSFLEKILLLPIQAATVESALPTEKRNKTETDAEKSCHTTKSANTPKRPNPPRANISEKSPTKEEMLLKAKVNLEIRHQELQLQSSKIKKETDVSLEKALQDLEKRAEKEYKRLLDNYEAEGIEIEKRRLEQQIAFEQHCRILAAKMEMAEQEARAVEEKRKKEIQEKLVAAILKEMNLITSCSNEFSKLLSSCQFQQLIPNVNELLEVLTQVVNKISSFLAEARNGGSIRIEQVRDYTEQGKKVLHVLARRVEEANRKGEEETKRQQDEAEEEKKRKAEEQEKQKQLQQQQQQQLQVKSSSADQADKGQAEVKGQKGNAQLEDIIRTYLKLQQLRDDTEKRCSALLNDSNLSKYRLDLVKAVVTPLNTIAKVNAPHLREKVNHFLRLLAGEMVEVGTKKVSTKNHEMASTFIRDSFAKQLVNKSKVVTSQRDVVFAIATIGISIWCEHKDVGDLIMAYIHLNCPYAVPFYMPKEQGKDTVEYYKSLGYLIEDGKVEEQSSFMKRMEGFIALYAALIISPAPPKHAHPHGLQYAWQWLAAIVNMDPQPDITAAVILSFLDVAGNQMMKTYKSQFWKLVNYLSESYLPKIENTGGTEAPVSRLRLFLQDAIRTKTIKEPKGYLGPNFWQS